MNGKHAFGTGKQNYAGTAILYSNVDYQQGIEEENHEYWRNLCQGSFKAATRAIG